MLSLGHVFSRNSTGTELSSLRVRAMPRAGRSGTRRCGIIAFSHDAAKSGYQLGSGRAQFVVVMQGEFAEDLLSLGGKREQDLAAIVLGAGAVDESSRLQTVDQFHGAMVADLHSVG